MTDCRAAVITAFNKPLEIQTIPLPDLEPTAMLTRVEAATLCGPTCTARTSSIGNQEKLPYIPGHETCGIVEEIRGERRDLLGNPLSSGDRVLWAIHPAATAISARSHASQPCAAKSASGGTIARTSIHTSSVAVRNTSTSHPGCNAIRVPDEVSAPLAASAACALRTVMHAFERLGAVGSQEQTCLIQGSGPVGLYAAAVAKDDGAHQVLMIGPPAQRLKVGKELARRNG